MKPFLKVLLQPTANRYYVGNKRSIEMHVVNYLLPVVICVYAALTVDKVFWWVLGGILAYAIIDYVVFDAASDRLTWRYFWSRFYVGKDERDGKLDPVHTAMKRYELHPTEANRKALNEKLRKSKGK